MKKEIISFILVLPFLSYIGCSSNYNTVRYLPQEVVTKAVNTDISVLTEKNEIYKFLAGKYEICNDTLSGTTSQEPIPPSKETRIMRIAIPLSEIVSIESRESQYGENNSSGGWNRTNSWWRYLLY